MAMPGEEVEQAGESFPAAHLSVSQQGLEHEPYVGCISVSVQYEALALPTAVHRTAVAAEVTSGRRVQRALPLCFGCESGLLC